MSVLTTARTARKTHWCSRCCTRIQPGQRYEDHWMTPRDEMNDGTAWRGTKTHRLEDCDFSEGVDVE
jgi:hypothetical protein